MTLVRLDAGDRIIESLAGYLSGPGASIRSGFFIGIGAARDCEIGFYDLDTGDYRTRLVAESCEIVSFTGNIARIGGEPVIHAHIVLGRPDFSVLGGHLMEGTVSVTGEIWIHGASLGVTREQGDFPGLKLTRFTD